MSINSLIVLVGLTAVFWTGVSCLSFPSFPMQRNSPWHRCPESYGLVLNDFVLRRDNVEAEEIDWQKGAYTADGPVEVKVANVKTMDAEVTIELKIRSKTFGTTFTRELDCGPGMRFCERKNMDCHDMNDMFGVKGQGMCDANSRFRNGRFDSQFKLPEGLENISGTVSSLLNTLSADQIEVELHVTAEFFNSETGERTGCLDIVLGVHLKNNQNGGEDNSNPLSSVTSLLSL
ncbi:uncharacterized protein LOC116307946 [Actinia tenebrosa]|uniref:Uncharacterized protein LOC116307946 n=1 Tax=Actinia tenebrosa TaxID=6105 RepID=A0A6P8JBX6_ACTTE|nr:uncharacterized protein LOC116307946 [Actinia tenebrosa]